MDKNSQVLKLLIKILIIFQRKVRCSLSYLDSTGGIGFQMLVSII